MAVGSPRKEPSINGRLHTFRVDAGQSLRSGTCVWQDGIHRGLLDRL